MLLPVFLLVGISAGRIISTYYVFSQTTDEPAHVTAGMEWLVRGTYRFEPLHPPLALVAVALGPFLSGIRLSSQEDLWKEGNEIFHARGRYSHNLALARLGVLPFFVIATVLVWHWSKVWFGHIAALFAVLLFTTSPVVLAHAGLATTDMPVTTTLLGALLAFMYWLEQPTYLRSFVLGLTGGLAILSKFSALLFLPTVAIALLTCRYLDGTRGTRKSRIGWPRWVRIGGLTIATTLLVVWAGYRFSVGPFATREARPHYNIDRFISAKGPIHDVVYTVAEFPLLPAPALFRGVAQVLQKDLVGHKAYLLGEIRETGWWYFFPVALAVKTPLPFLILTGIGLALIARHVRQHRDWSQLAPGLAALMLLLVCMPSRINVGVRHVLPIYPLLAIIAGLGAAGLWNLAKPARLGRVAVAGLVAWQLVSSIGVHPDYLAYFNELAGQHPERILTDSDLDWGQDLLRLAATLQNRGVREVSIAYSGSADLARHGLPSFRLLVPHQPTTGWIAISLHVLKTGGFGQPNDSFSWLESHEPVAHVGSSIWLYYVPAAGTIDAQKASTRKPAQAVKPPGSRRSRIGS